MATVKKRTNKDGSTSYMIRAFVDQGPGGNQTRKSMTWRPPAGMRPSTRISRLRRTPPYSRSGSDQVQYRSPAKYGLRITLPDG